MKKSVSVILFALIILAGAIPSIIATEYGIKIGYLHQGEYNFEGDIRGIRDDASSTVFGFEVFSPILPIIALNIEFGYTKSSQDLDLGPGVASTYDTRITPLTANALLMLGSDIIQVYGGGGFGLYYVKNTFHLETGDFNVSASNTEWNWGYQLKAGVKFWLSDSLGLYTEYQYRRFGDQMKVTTDIGNLEHDDDVVLSQICAGIVFTFF